MRILFSYLCIRILTCFGIHFVIYIFLQNKDIAPVRAKHRRSRSSDYWLEHKPTETLHTGSLLQNIFYSPSKESSYMQTMKRKLLHLMNSMQLCNIHALTFSN